MVTPVVARLRVFPFKSLDGANVAAATVVGRGALRLDRAFALVDAGGGYVNGKREPRVHEVRVTYDVELTRATFTSRRVPEPFEFAFDGDTGPLAAWFGRHFERPIVLRRDDAGGFPDDEEAPGPTIVSRATLEAVAAWFPELDAAGVRDRLRANVEIDGVPAFWEDRLYGSAGTVIAFRIGDVALEGTNPCARCIVPCRDPVTGSALAQFAKVVAERRAASLPAWADRSRFDHFYRLAINTRASTGQAGRTMRVGDAVATATPV